MLVKYVKYLTFKSGVAGFCFFFQADALYSYQTDVKSSGSLVMLAARLVIVEQAGLP